jgi:hypothetical protein
MRNGVIVLLALAVAMLTFRLAEVGNQRYALLLGMCPNKIGLLLPDTECLAKVQTRTHMLWHVFYAIKG